MKYCSRFHERIQPPKRQWLSVCLYFCCQRVKESYQAFWPDNAAREPNQAAKGQGEDASVLRSREWGGGIGRDLPPCLPGEGHRLLSRNQLGMCHLISDVPEAGCSWSVHLLWHFCLAESGASVASTTDHLLENMYVKNTKMSKMLLNAGWTYAWALLSCPLWRAGGKQAHMSFAPFN